MAVDLTGLNPVRERSQQLLDYSFQPKGGVPEEELLNDIQKKLWGTGTTPGIYSRFAGQGIRPVSVGENRLDIPPELNYSTSRAITESIQDLANQYQTRQRAAIDTNRMGGTAVPAAPLPGKGGGFG